MNTDQPGRGVALLLALFPGWGHIYLGNELQGLLIFTLFAAAGFTWLNSLWIYLGPHQRAIGACAGLATLALVVFSIADIYRRTAPWRLEKIRRQRDQLLWEGMLGFLRSEYRIAEEKFLECARLDPLNPEPLVRAGIVAARSGAPHAARRILAKAARLDLDGKWVWEIQRELGALRAERKPEPERQAGVAHQPAAGAR